MSRIRKQFSHRESSSSLAKLCLFFAARPGKPPPPPRNQSLEDWSRLDPTNKPVRPPPLRAEAKASVASPSRSDKMSSKATWRPTTATTSDSIYANLGKFRPIQCNWDTDRGSFSMLTAILTRTHARQSLFFFLNERDVALLLLRWYSDRATSSILVDDRHLTRIFGEDR